MDNAPEKNILVWLKDPSIKETLQNALNNAQFSNFDRSLMKDAMVVVTDMGIEEGADVPGYIPVLVIHDEDEERLHTYFSHELSPFERPETFQNEFVRYAEIADISRNIALNGYNILENSQLNMLVEIGGYSVVKAGIEQFVRNTTLQLNECRAMIEQEDYDFVRYTFHAIKNNAINLGARQLSEFSSAMEDAIQSENYPNFEAMLELAYTLLSSFEYVTRSWTEESISA